MFRALSIIFFSGTILICAHCSAEAQQIQGQVRYADSAKAVVGALVRCDGAGGLNSQITERNGKFLFLVSPGHYTVTVRFPGFMEEQRSVDLIDKQQSEYMLFVLRGNDSTSNARSPRPPVIDASVPPAALREFEKADAVLASDSKNRIQEGITHLEKAVTIYPKFLEAQLSLGASYMDLHRWEDAEGALRRVLELDPNTANAYFGLGEIYLAKRKYSDAERSLQAGLAIEDRSWRGHLALGRLYWNKNNLAAAGKQVGLAIQLNPEFPEAHLLAGNILLRAQKREDALSEFKEYLRLAPKGEFAAQAREAVRKLQNR